MNVRGVLSRLRIVALSLLGVTVLGGVAAEMVTGVGCACAVFGSNEQASSVVFQESGEGKTVAGTVS